MGSSVADVLYACIGSFGLTFISDFLFENQTIINILGGTLILFMGIKTLVKQSEVTIAQPNATGTAKMFLSSLVDGIQLVSGIFIGTLLWWVALVAIVGVLKNKMFEYGFMNLNKIFGMILLLFSVAVLIKTIQF